MNARNQRLYYLLFSFLLAAKMNLCAQESLTGISSSYLKSLRDSTIKEIRIVEIAEDGSIINLNAIHEFSSNGRIRKSKLFYPEPFQHQLDKFYHYDSIGICSTEQKEGSNWSMQQINLFYKDIDISVLNMGKLDTSKFLFEKIKSITRKIQDTAKLEDYQKISRVNILISRNDSLQFTITKADLMDDRIYTEVSRGSRKDSVVWRYDENGALTKTFYGADRIKSKLLRFSKNGNLIFEEHFGSPFSFVIEIAYNENRSVKERRLISGNGNVDKNWRYSYNKEKLLTSIEEYSAYDNKTKFLRYDYAFN
jgi:hypothetical protein